MRAARLPDKITIDYYFAPMSGYAYLGHARLLDIAARAGAQIAYHPLDMAMVFEAAGSFPPAKYPAVRQHHRKADMARWAQKLSMPINPTPKFWPMPMPLACQVIVAAKHRGLDQGAVTQAILSAVWTHDLNISDAADIATALRQQGMAPDPILAATLRPDIITEATSETRDAIALGIFGSPTYVIGDDWFFGQDRLEFLEYRLGFAGLL
ncbi:MAG: 2-hydroxychromene-2-carboxylate isomerase [Glaciecola sp.]|jgi:2-hydroxychromene-2-carboxylate isomerase